MIANKNNYRGARLAGEKFFSSARSSSAPKYLFSRREWHPRIKTLTSSWQAEKQDGVGARCRVTSDGRERVPLIFRETSRNYPPRAAPARNWSRWIVTMPFVCLRFSFPFHFSRLRGLRRENVRKDPSTGKSSRKCPLATNDRSLFENTIARMSSITAGRQLVGRFLQIFPLLFIHRIYLLCFILFKKMRILISFYPSTFKSGIDRTNEIIIGRIPYKNVNQFEKYCEFIIALLWLSHFYESDLGDNAWFG